MENQALFSSKDKSKTLKCRLLHFLFCALRVKCSLRPHIHVFGYFFHLRKNASTCSLMSALTRTS